MKIIIIIIISKGFRSKSRQNFQKQDLKMNQSSSFKEKSDDIFKVQTQPIIK